MKARPATRGTARWQGWERGLPALLDVPGRHSRKWDPRHLSTKFPVLRLYDMAKQHRAGGAAAPGPVGQALFNLRWRRMRSLIMAMNSLLVGLPLVLDTV